MNEHVILFDAECPFCHRAVTNLIEDDVKRHFLFAPLGGQTANAILTGPQEPLKRANSLVLVENYDSTDRTFWVRSGAMFRICWLLGNGWGLIGIFSFLPPWLFDWAYRWFAAHRHQFKIQIQKSAGPKNRFLP